MAGMNDDRRNSRNRGNANGLVMLPFLIVSIVFLVIGVVMLLPNVPIFGLVWILFCVYFIGIAVKSMAGKPASRRRTDGQEPARPASSAAPRPAESQRGDRRTYQPAGQEHDHIRSVALSPQRKLEQLETLRDAGLLTDEEYREKKREIMKKF